MATLIYTAITSLDSCVADREVAGQPPVALDYAAVWQAADKVVFSRTLEAASSARTQIERAFDPEAVLGLKASAERDLTVGGPELAGHAIRAGLVDEYRLFVTPVGVGGASRARGRPHRPRAAGRALLPERRGLNALRPCT